LPLFALAAGFSPALMMAQAPAPAAILNAASNVPMALPAGAIAQGAIFVLYGKNMGGPTLSQATELPLPKIRLNGTSVTVTAGATTLQVPLLYTLSTQIAGVLPSTTPVGNATLNVSYGGVTGTLAFKVVKSGFGISTVDQSGAGTAVVTFGDIALVTPSKPAKIGDTLIIWGTGLGPTSVDDSIVPPQVDLNTGAKVFVAGKEATVVYAGRSAGPGLDQINFKVPDGVYGCRVSLVVQIGSLVSNFTNIAVAPAGEACADFGNPKDFGLFGGSLKVDYTSLLPSLLSRDTTKIGIIDLEQTSRNDTVGFSFPGATSTQAYFLNANKTQLASVLGLFTPAVSAGSCTVFFTPAGTAPSVPTDAGIDAGPTVTLTPPAGAAIVMTAQKPGIYSQSVSKIPPGPAWGVANAGGSAVPAFKVDMALPQAVAWMNAGDSSSIDRTKGLVIKWAGGDVLNNFVEITGTVAYGTAPNNGTATIDCNSVQQPLTFTIPPTVFQALPATANLAISLAVNSSDPAQILQVPGTDVTLGVSHQLLTFNGVIK
jgi:uncharacterized protein (TIGR03437 family)